jgi:hypothetical protein
MGEDICMVKGRENDHIFVTKTLELQLLAQLALLLVHIMQPWKPSFLQQLFSMVQRQVESLDN